MTEQPYCLIHGIVLNEHRLRHGCPHGGKCIKSSCEGYSSIKVEMPEGQSTLEPICGNITKSGKPCRQPFNCSIHKGVST